MFNDNKDFYPTPTDLINKMLDKVDFNGVKNVLEPSAGKGHIVEELLQKGENHKVKFKNSFYADARNFNIDCIEIDTELQAILRDKKYKVVHDNFLTYQGFKRYDLIIANFPFSEGDKHLLKALELIENGGQLVCLINAKTLRNSYSNARKDLSRKLEELNASIEYLEDEFVEAERKTNVEVALIYVNVPKKNKESVILNKLKQEEEYKSKENKYTNSIVNGDFLTGIIEQYNFEIKVGIDLINEYNNVAPMIMRKFNSNDICNDCILNLQINKYAELSKDNDLVNNFIINVRYKYWTTLFENPQFTKLLTTNLLYELREKVNELVNYDFSLYNIQEIQKQMNLHIVKGVEDTILGLFEEFSQKHTYNEECKNIHYYNGWKTNSSYKINSKVIIPLTGFDGIYNDWYYRGKFYEKLKDIEHIFDYLDDCKTEPMELNEILQQAQKEGQTKNIETKYFNINVYKKGTTHLIFKNEELLKKFNIFGSLKKGWLPSSYGKKKYSDMQEEEKDIIDEFEGEKEYNNTMQDTKYYLYNPSNVLMISGN